MPAEERFASSRAARSWNRPERARGSHMDDAGDVHGDAFSASYFRVLDVFRCTGRINDVDRYDRYDCYDGRHDRYNRVPTVACLRAWSEY